MIHDTAFETSVVFPHPKGPPYKNSLHFLAESLLQRTIQKDMGTVSSIP